MWQGRAERLKVRIKELATLYQSAKLDLDVQVALNRRLVERISEMRHATRDANEEV